MDVKVCEDKDTRREVDWESFFSVRWNSIKNCGKKNRILTDRGQKRYTLNKEKLFKNIRILNKILQDSKDGTSLSFLFQSVVWVSTIGSIKYNQPIKKIRNVEIEPWEKFCLKNIKILLVYIKNPKFPDLLYQRNCYFKFRLEQIKDSQTLLFT